jgi:DNA polymerase III alpha subunit (gram-positive type)
MSSWIKNFQDWNISEANRWHGKSIEEYVEEWNSKFAGKNLIFFDTETTGLHHQNDQVTEIAAIAIGQDGEELGSFRKKLELNPGILDRRPRAEGLLKGSGYWNDKDTYEDEQESLEAFWEWVDSFDNAVLVAQNAVFDMRFTSRVKGRSLSNYNAVDTKDIIEIIFLPAVIAASNAGDEWAIEVLDKLPKSGRTGLPSSSMGRISKALDIDTENWHQADADVKMMIEMFKTIQNWLESKSGEGLDIRPSQEKWISRKRYFDKKRRMNRKKSRFDD